MGKAKLKYHEDPWEVRPLINDGYPFVFRYDGGEYIEVFRTEGVDAVPVGDPVNRIPMWKFFHTAMKDWISKYTNGEIEIVRNFDKDPWFTQAADDRGHWFEFRYEGGEMVTIHELIEDEDTGKQVAASERSFAIDLNSYGLVGKVTAEWLDERAEEWISDRNADWATGDYDRTGL